MSSQSNHTCEDINECEVDNGDCDRDKYECINTEGSYECDCLLGFSATLATKDNDIRHCEGQGSIDGPWINSERTVSRNSTVCRSPLTISMNVLNLHSPQYVTRTYPSALTT